VGRFKPTLFALMGAVGMLLMLLMTGTVESYLKRWYFAEPQFILMMLGTFASIGLLLVITPGYTGEPLFVLRSE
jgi:hypothetical protein